MKNILETIVSHKRDIVNKKKLAYPVSTFEQSPLFARKPHSLVQALRSRTSSNIIAEFKLKSPSQGIINSDADIIETTNGYVKAGAAALSVLTDAHFFGGTNAHLTIARTNNDCPILRKDFIIDEYQVIEAKSIGADAILLIGAALPPKSIEQFSRCAHLLGLEVLLEVHTAEELKKILDNTTLSCIDIIGVNNRNLKTFSTSIENSISLAPLIPDEVVKISESGLRKPDDLVHLLQHGFEGFLIGQQFMEQAAPADSARRFIHEYTEKKAERQAARGKDAHHSGETSS